MQFTPLDDQVLVRRDLGEATQGKLHVPDRAVERPLIGEVLAVGPGRRLPSGERVPCSVEPGQRVVFKKYAGTDLRFDGAECMVLREADLLGVLEEGPRILCRCDGWTDVAAHPACPGCGGSGRTISAGSRSGKTLPVGDR